MTGTIEDVPENCPAIYEIVNTVNGNRYVGSTITTRTRWNVHRAKLRAGTHHSRHLQAAWLKYGENSFEFRVIQHCASGDLLQLEQAAIDRLRPAYNICAVAGTHLGVKRTAETRARISASLSGKESRARSEAMRLRWADPYYREKHAARVISVLRSPEVRAANSSRMRALWQSEEFRTPRAEANRARMRDPLILAKHNKSIRLALTEESRKRRGAAQARIQGSPEARALRSAKASARWRDPAFRARASMSNRAQRRASGLSGEKVSAIRRDLAAGLKQYQIALKHGVNQSTVSDIKRGTHWSMRPAA